MFYLHGKIIEDQGIPAVTPEFGTYEYEAIWNKLSNHGFTIISEQIPKNSDETKYATRVAGQITELLNADVPAKNIIVVGASKGAGITIAISNILANQKLNYVLLGTCDFETIQFHRINRATLIHESDERIVLTHRPTELTITPVSHIIPL